MRLLICCLSSLLVLSSLAPRAEASEYPFSLEGIAVRSQLDTNIPGLEDEADGYGARLVYRFAGRLGIELQASQVTFEGDLPSFDLLPVALTVPIDLDVEMADLSLRFSFVRRSHFDFFVFGGIGYIGADVTASALGFSFRESGETYTWHGGAGFEIGLGDRLFLRGDARKRELPDDEEDGFVFDIGTGDIFRIDLDIEFGVSLGIRL